MLERDPSRRPEIRAAMRERVERVLANADSHGYDAAVLGAWSCGVFGNGGAEVAVHFRRALDEGFRGVFSWVIFAILDGSEDGHDPAGKFVRVAVGKGFCPPRHLKPSR